MKQAENKRAELLRAISRERLEALVLERAGRDEGFALWLDARFAVSVADEASTLLDPGPYAEAVAAVGGVDTAIDLAAWGLSRDGRGEGDENWRHRTGRAMLARWLREKAHEAGNRDMMFRAARVAFEESLAREDFRVAEKLAGPSDCCAKCCLRR
ncbi:hypothetical protein N183_31980 [Sinorhizobium sp. Sb3]|uniref:hypothetical protein n=1 Tax=Sinorhizobium sp. Sb3 TaxID=1358417 RepID=UPI00071CB3CD|nr:hypothetical protein [Sinorhizobium sp. Sb3]KSV67484.1 hypothetical protein N183_31980 [Sinorhizobium sp. Sb3]